MLAVDELTAGAPIEVLIVASYVSARIISCPSPANAELEDTVIKCRLDSDGTLHEADYLNCRRAAPAASTTPPAAASAAPGSAGAGVVTPRMDKMKTMTPASAEGGKMLSVPPKPATVVAAPAALPGMVLASRPTPAVAIATSLPPLPPSSQPMPMPLPMLSKVDEGAHRLLAAALGTSATVAAVLRNKTPSPAAAEETAASPTGAPATTAASVDYEQHRKQLLDALITNANTKGPTILGQGVAPATMTQSVGALARAAGGLEIPTPVARVTPPPVIEITPRPGRPDPVLKPPVIPQIPFGFAPTPGLAMGATRPRWASLGNEIECVEVRPGFEGAVASGELCEWI